MTLKTTLAAAAAFAMFAGAAYAQTAEAPVAAAPAEPAVPAAEAPVAAAPAPAPEAPAYAPIAAKGDVVETLKASGQFKTFTKALDQTNLTALVKAHQLTVFAPTDAAFAALPAGELDRLMKTENAGELQGLLAYHLVNANVDSTKIKGAKGPVATVAKAELLLDGASEGGLKANSAPILQSDVRTTKGTIHVVGAVLSPSDPVIAAAKAEAAEAAAAATEATTTPAG